MLSRNKPITNAIDIYHEGRRRRTYVGQLTYNEITDRYELLYDKKYANSKQAIPIGPDLQLTKMQHLSEKGKLFPSFLDRIPDRANPAYEDYCRSQGISPDEDNLIILLGTIGKRGPSTFIFEQIYEELFNPSMITRFRKEINLTQHDFARAFDISKLTLQRIESGVSHDRNTLKYLQIIFKFPEVALWQLTQTGPRIHANTLVKLSKYFLVRYNNSIKQIKKIP